MEKTNKKIYKFQPLCVGHKDMVGIIATIGVDDSKLSLYKSLLPAPLELPSKPQIMFYMKRFSNVFPWPMRSFLEAAVCIRTQHPKTQEGWFVLTMAVSSAVAYRTGLWLGYPKYIPDSMTLESSGNNWIGKIMHQEKSPFTLQFSPADIDVWWKDVYRKDSAYFLLNKKSQINQMQGFIQEVKNDELKTGKVTISVDSTEKWADLVPKTNNPTPGILNRFSGKMFLTRKDRSTL